MSINTTFILLYGFELPSDLKRKSGEEFDGISSGEMDHYICGSKEADGFILVYD